MGKINGAEIADIKKEGNDIYHVISGQIPFRVGDTVKLELEWMRRFKAMKLHSAPHLLAGPFDKNFGKRAVAGAIKNNQAYLVFKEEISDEIINKCLEQANEDIKNGLEIKSY